MRDEIATLKWVPPAANKLERRLVRKRLAGHPGLAHLHHNWMLPDSAPDMPRKGVRGRARARFAQAVFRVLGPYLQAERDFITHLVQLNDALAKRCDELADAHSRLLDDLDRQNTMTASANADLVLLLERQSSSNGTLA